MQRLSIGAFSRLTHLSVKTLRYYHEVGLLEPAVVDPDSGYRYYRPGQAQSAHLVRRFRDLGLPVADVKAVLAAPDLTARNAILAGHLDRMRDQLRQTEAAVDSLRRMLDDGAAPVEIEERLFEGGTAISVAADVLRKDVAAWWLDALARLQATATAAGLEQTGPVGGIYDDELFTQDAGHARVYLPVRDCPALHEMDVRWELPAARYAVTLHVGPHRDVDRSYAALGTYAAAHGRDAAGPVRERYLTGPADTTDQAQWRTEVCWPLAPARPEAS
ncbi:MAG TPA: MerR family transcriptional regulator [Trebonia sp.]|jgi:DNA-binding transcriptional MerR regulator|nr:MerR family transcriptional regulator [Trebonia sp.]